MSGDLEVLLADNHLLAIAKPAGMPSVPDASGDPSALELARRWVKREYEKPGAVYLGVVHRLDRPVSGVLLFARTSKAAARLSACFRERGASKVYWGLCEGIPAETEGVVEQWLLKDGSRNRVRSVDAGRRGARLARTRWRVLGTSGGRAWLELVPQTGRPHQLRHACAALGAPLLGDLKYGASAPLPDRSIALHAVRLEFEHPTRSERVRLETPPPPRPWWDRSRGGC